MRFISLTIAFLIALLIPLSCASQASAQVAFPNRGGTGTSVIPSLGQVLVGNSGGTYTPTATGSLGITAQLSGGIAGTLAAWLSGSTLGPTSSPAVSSITATSGTSTFQGVTATGLKLGSLSGILKAIGGWITGSATTSDLPEGSNEYFTTARARAALSAGTGISYSTSTGVISAEAIAPIWGAITGALSDQTDLQDALDAKYDASNPDSFVSDLSGFSTSDLSEGARLYFTNARADARINATSSIGTITAAPNLGTVKTSLSGLLKAASGVLSAAVSNTDYQAPITLTTTGSSGAASFNGTTLNVPQYAGGTVTSVGLTAPTGLSVSGSPVTSSGTLALSLTSGYAIPLTASTTDWNTAYLNRITSATSPLSISSNAISCSSCLTAAITAIGPSGQTQTGSTITLATSTSATNGITSAIKITGSGNTLTFQPSQSGTLTVAGGGTGAVTFSTAQLLYGRGTSAVATVATSSPTFSSPLTTSGTAGYLVGGSGFTIGCQTASGSQAGCLSSADWTTFNGKQAAGNYITAFTGDVTASGPGSVAATLATVNSNVGSFTNANITVNAKGLITAAANGSSAGLSTTSPWTTGQLAQAASNGTVSSVATSSLGIALSDTTGTLAVTRGGTGTSTGTTNGVEYFDGTKITNSKNLTYDGAAQILTVTQAANSEAIRVGSIGSIGGFGGGYQYYSTNWAADGSGFSGKNLIGNAVVGVGVISTMRTDASTQVGGIFTGAGNASAGTSYTLGTDLLPALEWDTAQRVGVGRQPLSTAQLAVNAPAGLSSFLVGSTTTQFIITSAGNVGIGTTSPSANLNVYGTTNLDGALDIREAGTVLSGTAMYNTIVRSGSTGNTYGLALGYDSAINGGIIAPSGTAAARSLAFWTYSGSVWGERLRITGAGNVGIGTTTPAATLGVVGDGMFSGTLRVLTHLVSVIASAFTPSIEGEIGVDTTDNQLKFYSGGAVRVVSPTVYASFTYSTSTAWTGTTTIPLGPAGAAETWQNVKCFTDAGTVGVSLYDGSNRMNYVPTASTTVNAVPLTTNNSFTAGEKRYVDVGNPASAPTKVSCTIAKTIDPT